ncbi:hypothetical protein QBC47DRAFT_38571 [Echria macrotheca]|uniref:Rhodopsin domain-containing protein n=1 Tax=Echria macrotheca TaxID=438768 RepID=A0AAJ0B9V9_9PEZI|nr:hypothetical protein QBC47DRAFT_38571 [Echria macrotheca]
MASNEDRGPMLQSTIFLLFSGAFCAYVSRIYIRLSKTGLTSTDYSISAAMLADLSSTIFTSVAIGHGFGKHTSDIPGGPDSLITISNCLLCARMTGMIASGLSRISMASLLYPLVQAASWEHRKRWKCLLWGIIVSQLLLVVAYGIVQLVQYLISKCHKTEAYCLDPTQKTECLSPTQALVFSYTSFAIWTLSDCICTIISSLLIYPLQRPWLERAFLIVLMASCLLATLCGIPRIYYLSASDRGTSDALWELIPELIWRYVEQCLILIASCAPFLKPLIEKGLRRLGMPTFGILIRELNRASSLPVTEGSCAERREWEGGKRVVWSRSSDSGK